MMNYLHEIIAFDEMIGLKPLSSGQIALWYALMAICNKLSWQEWFAVSSQVLETKSGLSKRGVVYARNRLKELGMIDFRVRDKKPTLYRIIPCSSWSHFARDTAHDVAHDTAHDVAHDTAPLNKQNKTKRESPKGDNPPYPPKAFNPAAHGYQENQYNADELERHIFVSLDD